MVVERSNSTVQVPGAGFITLTNNNVVYGVTTNSGVQGVGSTAFTDHVVVPSPSSAFFIVNDIVPQYYEYVGYVVTTFNTVHNPAAMSTGSIILDYGTSVQYWVTIYIRPRPGQPGDYTWDWRTNDFGSIIVP
jgi:hypothetical protein